MSKYLSIARTYFKTHTIGVLKDFYTGEKIAVTMERPDKENEQGISCIPAGSYECKLVDSPLMKRIFKDELAAHPELGKTFELQDVPMRTHILIHPANWAHELEGCIAPGMEYLPTQEMVTSSKTAYKKFRRYVGDEPFRLLIK